MDKVFIISGGAGRVLAAIPALEHYITSNPTQNVRILVHGWDSLFWSNKLLQPITFNAGDKGVFEEVKYSRSIESPEPYILPGFIRQEVSMTQAFDILINGQDNGLAPLQIDLADKERLNGLRIVEDVIRKQGKDKTVVIQPFGRGARPENIKGNICVFDESYRSFTLDIYTRIIESLAPHCNLILFAEQQFFFEGEDLTFKLNADQRTWMSIIAESDYFVGCDSLGQHMARGLNIPGTLIFGSTFPINVSYPDWFRIIDKYKDSKLYAPMRLSDLDTDLASAMNSHCMDYTQNEIQNVCDLIISDLKEISSKNTPVEQNLSGCCGGNS